MSTWWYYECTDHQPPIVSADEFTQHTDDEYFRRGVELIAERPLSPLEWGRGESIGTYFERRARDFLTAHPNCQIGLVNEYGEHHAVSAPEEAPHARD